MNVTVEITLKQRPYAGKQSTDTMEFRVFGVLVTDTDDYLLYATNLPDEFTPRQVAVGSGVAVSGVEITVRAREVPDK